jgi:hypothetical protein
MPISTTPRSNATRQCTEGPRAGLGRARLGLLIDLRIAELANALGLRYRMLNLRRLIVVVLAGLGVAIPAIGFAAVRLFAVVAPDVPASALIIPLVALLAGISLSGVLLAETVGKYRDAVSHHPNRHYFRSLDIPVHLVHLVYVVPRLAAALALWLLLALGIIIGLLSSEGPGTWLTIGVVLLGGVPVACVLGALSYSLYRAGAQHRRPAHRGFALSLFVVVGALLGATGGQVISSLGLPTGDTEETMETPSSTVPGQDSAAIFMIVVVPVVIALSCLCAVQYTRLQRRLFVIDSAAMSAAPLRSTTPLILQWPMLLWAQRQGSWRHKAEFRCLGTLLAVVTALVVLALMGAPMLDDLLAGDPTVDDRVRMIICFGSALLGVSIAEFTTGDIGRYRMGPALRHAVELGAPVPLTTAAHAIALTGPALLCGMLATTAASLALGGPWLLPLLLTAGGCCAALVADRILPPPRAADGTTGEGIATPLAGVLMAGLPPVWLVALPQAAPIITPLTVTALVLGGIWCTRLNLVRLSA